MDAPSRVDERVVRERLLARLDAATQRKLTLIKAPAGFGKTTLLEQWAARSRAPAIVLALGERDNDPVALLAALAGALGAPGGPRREEALLAAVLSLLGPAQPAVLALDGYEAIHAEAVHRLVAALVERTPPGVRIVIASRTEPPLPVGRLRVRGAVTTIKQAELCFTAAEAAALLEAAGAPALAASDVEALTAATGGWAAGIELSAVALRASGAPGRLVDALASREIVLVDEVLRLQPEPFRSFLLATSILDVKTAAACDAITGDAGSEGRLAALCAAGLLRRLPGDPAAYRACRAFDEHLRALLEIGDPDRFASLRARAAACSAPGPALADPPLSARAGAADPLPRPLAEPPAGPLSGREREVVELLGAGYSCREIAQRLTLSFETVRTHCRRIFRKLGVRDREEAIQRAAPLLALRA